MSRRDREHHSTGDPQLRVVYISGASPSGSTALATLLASQADIISVGDLGQLHHYGWQEDDDCARASRCSACPFWIQVLAAWRERCADADVAGYRSLQSRYERLRSWPRLQIEARLKTSAFRDYVRQTTALLHAICAVSGKRVVLDSSKRPMRALALSLVRGVDLQIVHLVRNARATAWSQAKAYRKDPRNGLQADKPSTSVWKSTRDWLLANTPAARRGPRAAVQRCRLRYEDLVDRPEQTLLRLQSFLELDMQHVVTSVLSNNVFSVGHQIAGNRLRMQGAVRLRGDSEWMHAMPATDRDACWRLAGWLARRYGYFRNLSDVAPRNSTSPGTARRAPSLPQFRSPRRPATPEDRVPCSNG